MSYTMYPYDGVGNIPDGVFHWFFDQMVEQGLVETVFYSGYIKDSYQFALFIKTQTVPTVFIADEKVVTMAWLSDAMDGRALGHFCFLDEGRQYKLEMGKEMMRYWIDTLGVNTVLGIVPSFNKPAIKYIDDLGFVILGEIPMLIKRNGQPEPAYIAYFSREEL
jgi:hypothetical protein